jgi:hypothetical protein
MVRAGRSREALSGQDGADCSLGWSEEGMELDCDGGMRRQRRGCHGCFRCFDARRVVGIRRERLGQEVR